MKFSRMLQVIAVLLVMGLLAGNTQASVIYATGHSPKHVQGHTGKKHHKNHKLLAAKNHKAKHLAKHHAHHRNTAA